MNKEALHERLEFADMRDVVERCAEMYSDRVAYSYRVKATDKEIIKVTFPQLRDDVRALTSEFISRGYAGKHCVVIGQMSYEWAILYFSILAAGAVIVPLDRDWTAADLADTSNRAEADYLFCEAAIKEKAEAICQASEKPLTPIYFNGEGETVHTLKKAGALKFAADSAPYFRSPINTDIMSIMVFTSGTTGKGKGVMLTQRAVLSDMADSIQYMDFSNKTVSVLPPHHTFGSSVMILGHASIGSEIYISNGIRYVQRELKEQKPGHLVMVPLYLETFYRKINATLKEQGRDKMVHNWMKSAFGRFLLRLFKVDKKIKAAFGGELKMVISGGAALNREIVDFFSAVGISTLNGYGITECAPIIAVNHSKRNRPGSVGPVLDIDTVKIAEPNEDGEGEICVKGPNVMLGYFKNEEATAEAFDEEGFFRTGDYGKIGKDGALYITGRKKNLIILSNGKNVYPEEIENELISVPGILDIVVYEGKSKRGREYDAIVAEVYADPDFVKKNNIEDVKAYLQPFVNDYNRNAVPYKKIAILKVRTEEFPKNTLRKIMRFKLDTTIE